MVVTGPGLVFNSGVTVLCLNQVGQQPSLNDRLARKARSSEKMPGQDLRRHDGMKSMKKDWTG